MSRWNGEVPRITLATNDVLRLPVLDELHVDTPDGTYEPRQCSFRNVGKYGGTCAPVYDWHERVVPVQWVREMIVNGRLRRYWLCDAHARAVLERYGAIELVRLDRSDSTVLVDGRWREIGMKV